MIFETTKKRNKYASLYLGETTYEYTDFFVINGQYFADF